MSREAFPGGYDTDVLEQMLRSFYSPQAQYKPPVSSAPIYSWADLPSQLTQNFLQGFLIGKELKERAIAKRKQRMMDVLTFQGPEAITQIPENLKEWEELFGPLQRVKTPTAEESIGPLSSQYEQLKEQEKAGKVPAGTAESFWKKALDILAVLPKGSPPPSERAEPPTEAEQAEYMKPYLNLPKLPPPPGFSPALTEAQRQEQWEGYTPETQAQLTLEAYGAVGPDKPPYSFTVERGKEAFEEKYRKASPEEAEKVRKEYDLAETKIPSYIPPPLPEEIIIPPHLPEDTGLAIERMKQQGAWERARLGAETSLERTRMQTQAARSIADTMTRSALRQATMKAQSAIIDNLGALVISKETPGKVKELAQQAMGLAQKNPYANMKPLRKLARMMLDFYEGREQPPPTAVTEMQRYVEDLFAQKEALNKENADIALQVLSGFAQSQGQLPGVNPYANLELW